MWSGGDSGKKLVCKCRKLQTLVQLLGWDDPMEKGKATHFCILAWRIPRTEESGGLYVHRVAKSWPWLKQLSTHAHQLCCCCCCSVTQLCPTLWDSKDCNTPGLPVPHHLPELAQVHVHCINDTTQPPYPLTPSSLSAFNFFQHQGLFQWVSYFHQVTKTLELQPQHWSFQ